jgi:hypothetical protein
MKSLFSQIKFLLFQTLQKKGISRDYWKWILKFLKIKAAQLRAYSAIIRMITSNF